MPVTTPSPRANKASCTSGSWRLSSPSISETSLLPSEAAQQRGNRQALRKHGEGHDGKRNHYNHVTPRKILRQRQGKRECQCTPQSAPEKQVLMPHIHLESTAGKYRTQRVDGRRAAESYQGNREQHRPPKTFEMLLRFLRANQQKDQRIGHKRHIFPEWPQ